MKQIAVLISDKGTGTNLQAIIDGVKNHKINARIITVISDAPKALGLKRALKHNLPVDISPKKENLLPLLKKRNPDFICLAGWKQIVADEVIETFPHKILNLHPGLIPDKINESVKNPDGTKGLWNRGKLTEAAIENFCKNKATYAGSSIHFLTEEFDFGPVLGRVFEKIKKEDTIESLYTRLKKKENALYVKVLQNLTRNRTQSKPQNKVDPSSRINLKDNPKNKIVLVIDGGGRGSVLVDKYLQSPYVAKALAVPGNDLMLHRQPVKIFPKVNSTDISSIIKICQKENVDLIDVAQDDAVAVGLVDSLQKEGFKVFGPTKAAGQIEWDKAWARNFMKKFKIPSPNFKICQSQKEGIAFIKNQKEGLWFVKASGLATGKGSLYAGNNQDAIQKIRQMKKFGKSGKTFLIEECLQGEEFSSFAIVDGQNFTILGHAQDHKTVYNANSGPNTGGMGCCSPPKVITPKIEKQIRLIFKKTANGLVKIGRPYRGILYLGGMIGKTDKVYVIEFNARWGDPEAQVIIPSLGNDLYQLAIDTIDGKLEKIRIKKDNLYRIAVTAASRGYPGDYSKVIGKQIFGLDSLLRHSGVESDSTIESQVFGAGVKVKNGRYLANGGRLFYVIAQGKNVAQARQIAYNALSQVSVEGNNLHYRTDIGWQDLERLYFSDHHRQ